MDPEVVDDAAQEAADEAAFNEGANDTKVEAKTPTATPEPAKAAEVKVVEAPPEFVQLTKAQWDATQTELASMKATMEKSFGTAFGKMGDIERKQKAIDDWKASQGIVGEMSQDDFTELKEQFPELAESTVKGLNRSLAKLKGQPGAQLDPAKISEVVNQGVELRLKEREVAQQADSVKALDTEHKDWREVRAKPEFQSWLEKQPPRVQKTFEKTWDADFLSDVFTHFKTDAVKAKPVAAPAAPAPNTTRKDRLAAAVNPRGTGGHAPGPSDDDDFNAGFKAG